MDGLIHLQHLRSLHGLSTDAINQMPANSVRDFEHVVKLLDEMTDEEKAEVKQDFIRSRYLEQSILERMEAQSSFSAAFAAFEFTLTMTAESVLNNSYPIFELKDFKGQGLERSKFILRKLGGANNAFSTQSWARIQDFKKVRDKITHAGGLVVQGSKDTSYFEGIEEIGLAEFGDGHHFLQIDLSSSYVRSAFEEYDDFLEMLYRELEESPEC
ncbi:hypothetical protein [Actibacterium sp. MT2.3-13A]|uniref:hypothetical protein n=1 Tax=Actibacterium sp. MT2.3-13A TaxID=2828332 RepID=UPI001BA65D5F|nr:hypothetical protein [Actibacterium sp. MT2.3-13A]